MSSPLVPMRPGMLLASAATMGTRKFAGRSADGTDCQSRCANGGGGLPGVQGHRQQRPQRSTRTIGKIDDLLVTRDGKEPYELDPGFRTIG